jgi:hypothetical protein
MRSVENTMGIKETSRVTLGTCGDVGKRNQVILVCIVGERALSIGNISHP